MSSAGTRVVSSERLPPTEAAVSVAIAGGRWPTSGIGEERTTAISPWAPMNPCGVKVRDSTVYVPAAGSGTCAS